MGSSHSLLGLFIMDLAHNYLEFPNYTMFLYENPKFLLFLLNFFFLHIILFPDTSILYHD